MNDTKDKPKHYCYKIHTYDNHFVTFQILCTWSRVYTFNNKHFHNNHNIQGDIIIIIYETHSLESSETIYSSIK